MSFLVDQIKEQKILEMEVALDDFIESAGITERHMIHTMVFSKAVFEEEKEVREYLKDKYFYSPDITDTGDTFTAVTASPAQMDMDTELEVQLRRGVAAKAAELQLIPRMEEINFNEKGEALFSCSKLFDKDQTLNLSEGLPHIIEIARVAEGDHPSYGKLKITEEHLLSMESNFKSNATGVDLAVNEDHRKNEAFGWFKDVFLSFDKQTLYGQVHWNAKGIHALSEKEYRYFSPEFRFNYVHPHTGEEHGATLLGGALTNYPFLKMEAITELNHKPENGEKPMSEKATIELSVHEEKVMDLNSKLNTANDKVREAEEKNVELSNKVDELQKKIEKKDKEAAHKKLFDDGKITKAQMVALNEGKGMLEVLALSEKIHTDAKGSDETVSDDAVELSEKEKKICEQLDLTPEEYKAAN